MLRGPARKKGWSRQSRRALTFVTAGLLASSISGPYLATVCAANPSFPPLDGSMGNEAAQSSTTGRVRKHKGEIGGPPSTRLAPPDQGMQTTPALVIGRGRLFGGPVEIAGAGWSAPSFFETPGGGQLCVWIEYLVDQATSSMCGPVAQTASGEETVYIESLGGGMGGNGSRETEIAGSLAPDVAFIRVSFSRQGTRRLFDADAVVAHVGGELQKCLKQPASFGYFVIKVRGRFIERSLRIRAFDKEGRFVGASQGVSSESLP